MVRFLFMKSNFIFAIFLEVLKKIFSSEMIKNEICLGVQTSKMSFFAKYVPPKMHSCLQCLE